VDDRIRWGSRSRVPIKSEATENEWNTIKRVLGKRVSSNWPKRAEKKKRGEGNLGGKKGKQGTAAIARKKKGPTRSEGASL